MGKQIDFPPLQKEVRLIAPVLLGISILCVVIVLVVLYLDLESPFIGPWG
jgi:hypothetical protein